MELKIKYVLWIRFSFYLGKVERKHPSFFYEWPISRKAYNTYTLISKQKRGKLTFHDREEKKKKGKVYAWYHSNTERPLKWTAKCQTCLRLKELAVGCFNKTYVGLLNYPDNP